MPATNVPYTAADAINDARRLLAMAEQHAPFTAEAAGAFRVIADGYAHLATVLEPVERVAQERDDARGALEYGGARLYRLVGNEAKRADEAERERDEARKEMLRLGGLLGKQCDRIDEAEAAGYPLPGTRYADENGEEWTVGSNGLMHHHSYSQRDFDTLRREYGPLRRVG